MAGPLTGSVAVVAGATRGAGRGIAAMLGAAGAKVYCTGRSTAGHPATPGRPETIEETAEIVNGHGGLGVAVRVDHTRDADVAALFDRVRADDGRLDILVNDVWGGDALIDWGKRFWELDVQAVRSLSEQAILSHIITARYGAPLMLEANRGLIVEVTDGELAGYRGQLAYDLVKSSVIRLAYAMAWDLAATGVTALALSPGFLRSEAILDNFGVTEATWRDGVAKDPFFANSETPYFVGRAVAALGADPDVRRFAGATLYAADLAEVYGFTDADGSTPQFWREAEAWLEGEMAKDGPMQGRARWMGQARYGHVHLEPARADFARRLGARLGLERLPPALQPRG